MTGASLPLNLGTDIDEMVAPALGSLTKDFTVDVGLRYLDGEDCDVYAG